MTRVYGRLGGAGFPKPEDKQRCVVGLTEARGLVGIQCLYERGHGPDGEFCLRHASRLEGGKETLYVPSH